VESGASASLVNKELVEMSDFDIKVQKKPTKWDTANGVFNTDGTGVIENFNLPQFTRKRAITASFHMYHKKPTNKYDVILGRDLLKDIGFDIYYSASQFVWDNVIIDMVPSGHWMKEKIKSVAKTWNTKRVLNREENSNETGDESNEELCLATILPADYKPVEIASVVEKQTHLTAEEREKLHTMLLDFQTLFQGKRGHYNGDPIELELLPDAKPFYRKPFSIPKAYQQIMKAEIARLESIGLLNKVTSSVWAAPTFIIPKKNQTVCVITDFKGLNQCLKRNPYPMPIIPDIFRGMERFRLATMIDLNMGYYSMPLS
jgi:hypothetical protein